MLGFLLVGFKFAANHYNTHTRNRKYMQNQWSAWADQHRVQFGEEFHDQMTIKSNNTICRWSEFIHKHNKFNIRLVLVYYSSSSRKRVYALWSCVVYCVVHAAWLWMHPFRLITSRNVLIKWMVVIIFQYLARFCSFFTIIARRESDIFKRMLFVRLQL